MRRSCFTEVQVRLVQIVLEMSFTSWIALLTAQFVVLTQASIRKLYSVGATPQRSHDGRTESFGNDLAKRGEQVVARPAESKSVRTPILDAVESPNPVGNG